MEEKMMELLVDIHHQLQTDSDLESVTRPDRYANLAGRIEEIMSEHPLYAHLCQAHLAEVA